MRLGEKILKLRKRTGMSQEQLGMELGVSRQAVSKWESDQAVPDLDKIVLMSNYFNVCTDYLLKDEVENPIVEPIAGGANPSLPGTDTGYKTLSAEDVGQFIKARKKFGLSVAFGVMLCILSVLPMVIMDERPYYTSAVEGWCTAFMLLMVAAGVSLFVISGMSMSKYEYMEKEPLLLPDSVLERLERVNERFTVPFGVGIAAAIALCILSVVPAALMPDSDNLTGAILFVCVAAGVFVMINLGIKKSTYDTLLQKDGYSVAQKTSPQIKRKNRIIGGIAGFYWCVVAAGYLAYCFKTNDWKSGWFVWPVAGALFGGIAALVEMLFKKDGDD